MTVDTLSSNRRDALVSKARSFTAASSFTRREKPTSHTEALEGFVQRLRNEELDHEFGPSWKTRLQVRSEDGLER